MFFIVKKVWEMRYATFHYGEGVLYETPIFIDNRQESDVQAAIAINEKIAAEGWDALSEGERELYLTGIGALRFTDLNRIEYRAKEVLEQFHLIGYDLVELDLRKAEWTREDIPRYEADMVRICDNIQELLNTYRHDIGQPEITYVLKPNVFDINDLEETLKLLDKNIKSIAHGWYRYAGTTYAGGGIL